MARKLAGLVLIALVGCASKPPVEEPKQDVERAKPGEIVTIAGRAFVVGTDGKVRMTPQQIQSMRVAPNVVAVVLEQSKGANSTEPNTTPAEQASASVSTQAAVPASTNPDSAGGVIGQPEAKGDSSENAKAAVASTGPESGATKAEEGLAEGQMKADEPAAARVVDARGVVASDPQGKADDASVSAPGADIKPTLLSKPHSNVEPKRWLISANAPLVASFRQWFLREGMDLVWGPGLEDFKNYQPQFDAIFTGDLSVALDEALRALSPDKRIGAEFYTNKVVIFSEIK